MTLRSITVACIGVLLLTTGLGLAIAFVMAAFGLISHGHAWGVDAATWATADWVGLAGAPGVAYVACRLGYGFIAGSLQAGKRLET